MIGPSIVPMPPMITVKKSSGIQSIPNAASGEIRKAFRK